MILIRQYFNGNFRFSCQLSCLIHSREKSLDFVIFVNFGSDFDKNSNLKHVNGNISFYYFIGISNQSSGREINFVRDDNNNANRTKLPSISS